MLSSDRNNAGRGQSEDISLGRVCFHGGQFGGLRCGERRGKGQSEDAILAGDPDKVGSLFVFRIKQPDGSKIPPHWHPVDENVTLISGTFLYGVGEKFDEKAAA
jgi:quercetin dioxygenase-like cupin family protein